VKRLTKQCAPWCVLGALAAAGGAAAGEWEQSASLAMGAYYSDNICRAPNIKQDYTVGTVTPGVRVVGGGARSSLALNAAVEYNTLGESSLECEEQGIGQNLENRETWVPRLRLVSELEAVENLFYLEADAFAAQNPINPFAAGGNDNINATGNQNITYRWGAGARIDRRFGEYWAALIRYNYNEQYNSFRRALGNSQEDRVTLDIGMVPGVTRLRGGVRGQYSEVAFEETDLRPEFTNRLSRLELYSALQLTDSLSFDLSGGQEDNVFISANDENDGTFWDAGFTWNPNSRVVVAAGYGERFFGDAPRLSISYRHKRSQLSATYLRDVRFPRNIRSADGGALPDDPFDPGIGLPGDPLPGAGDPTFIGQTPVLNEALTVNYLFDARRTTFRLAVRDSQQTRFEDGRTGSFRSATAVVSRNFARRLTADLRVLWRNNEGQLRAGGGVGNQDLEAWTVGAGLQRRLSDSTVLSLRYRYTDQTSNNQRNTFEEQRVDIGLRLNF
jgi:hypothetical protein